METETPLFIAVVHLEKLAKMLHMLGFDKACSHTFSTDELVSIALQQQRLLLSRSANVSRHQPFLHFFFISFDKPEAQLKQVLQHFDTVQNIQPFIRCIVCN